MANETDFIDDVIETEELTTSDRLLDEEVLEHEDRFAQSEVEASARSNSTASRISNFSKRSSQASIKSRRAYGIDASFEEAPEDATNHPEEKATVFPRTSGLRQQHSLLQNPHGYQSVPIVSPISESESDGFTTSEPIKQPPDRSTTGRSDMLERHSVLHYPHKDQDRKVISPVSESYRFNKCLSEQIPQSVLSMVTTQDNLEFVLESTQTSFYDFKIPDISTALKLNSKINSPPFVVTTKDTNGYKVSMQVYFGQDYMSVAIAIMKGSTNKLPWPFDRNVVFRLVNLDGSSGGDKLRAFRCDMNGSRFKDSLSRPKSSEINPPIGFPFFISRQCLLHNSGFIRNNTMHVQCLILPKAIELRVSPEMPVVIK